MGLFITCFFLPQPPPPHTHTILSPVLRSTPYSMHLRAFLVTASPTEATGEMGVSAFQSFEMISLRPFKSDAFSLCHNCQESGSEYSNTTLSITTGAMGGQLRTLQIGRLLRQAQNSDIKVSFRKKKKGHICPNVPLKCE